MNETKHAPSTKHAPRWGMVIDVNRCVGCQTCTIACKHANDTLPIYLTEQAIRGSQIAAVLCIVGEALLLAIIGFWISRRSRR